MPTGTCHESLGSSPHDSSPPINLTDTIYGILPSRTLDLSSADFRASSLPAKRFHASKSPSSIKRKGTAGSDHGFSRPSILPPGYWIAPKAGKRARLDAQKDLKMELHQSTCLNLNSTADSSSSDMWILPDFEEWEADVDSAEQLPAASGREWAPLVERAVNSNRERLRRRLEGDGWDFVGGRYGNGEELKGYEDVESRSGSEESVDAEFDVVVLPIVEVS